MAHGTGQRLRYIILDTLKLWNGTWLRYGAEHDYGMAWDTATDRYGAQLRYGTRGGYSA